MGSIFSFPSNNAQGEEHSESSQVKFNKRQKVSSICNIENPRLIPGLPDEISLQILARLPRIFHLNMKMVSRSWKAAITGPEVYRLRKKLGRSEEWLYILTKVKEDKFIWHALDPLSGRWQRLPPMPNVIYEQPQKGFFGLLKWNVMGSSIKISDMIKGWLGLKDALDQLPLCGCAIEAVNGCLYVLGGVSKATVVKCAWCYDPCLNLWQEVSSMTTGRAFCKTSVLNNKLYVVGGITRCGGGLTPLQSGEVYDPCTGLWTQMPDMPFSKAQNLPTAFLTELLRPIATGMNSYRGKLCVPCSLYSWPFFVDVGGEIYDPDTNSWVDMPVGMGEGWPAKQAGTELSVVVNGELYALDPSCNLDSGKIKVYDQHEDAWKVVIEVPLRDLTDSESPYLLTGFLSKLHLVMKDTDGDVAVMQADMQCISSCCSSSPPAANFTIENPDIILGRELDNWKLIATKKIGSAELVSCRVLGI